MSVELSLMLKTERITSKKATDFLKEFRKLYSPTLDMAKIPTDGLKKDKIYLALTPEQVEENREKIEETQYITIYMGSSDPYLHDLVIYYYNPKCEGKKQVSTKYAYMIYGGPKAHKFLYGKEEPHQKTDERFQNYIDVAAALRLALKRTVGKTKEYVAECFGHDEPDLTDQMRIFSAEKEHYLDLLEDNLEHVYNKKIDKKTIEKIVKKTATIIKEQEEIITIAFHTPKEWEIPFYKEVKKEIEKRDKRNK